MDESSTFSGLTESIKEKISTYGEESVLASLFFALQSFYIEEDDVDMTELIKSRMEDLDIIHNKWVSQNEPREQAEE